MPQRKIPSTNLILFCGYVLFFGLYLLIYPLQNSLIGSGDVILHLVIFNEYWNSLSALFGAAPGYSFYPAHGLSQFSEPYWGEALFFLVPNKLLGLGDAVSIWFMMVLIHALNAFAMYHFTGGFIQKKPVRWAAGIFFAASCFMLSHAEQLNGVAFFCTLFSLKFLNHYHISHQTKHLVLSMIFLGLQAYFSLYLLFAGSLLYVLYFAYSTSREELSKVKGSIWLVLIPALLLLPLMPKVLMIVRQGFDPFSAGLVSKEHFSISLESFITSFGNNLLYRNLTHDASIRAFSGIGLLFLVAAGAVGARRKAALFYLLLIAVFTALAFGDFMEVGAKSVAMPMLLFDRMEVFGSLFRMPYRFYIISAFALSVMAAYGLEHLLERFQIKALGFVLFFICLFLLENIQFPPVANPQINPYLSSVESQRYLEARPEKRTVAYLPSALFLEKDAYLDRSDVPFNRFVREYIYAYWNLSTGQNTINGASSYFPHMRVQNDSLIRGLESDGNLEQLITDNQLHAIIFDKRMAVDIEELAVYELLRSSELLEEVVLSDQVSIFEISGSAADFD